MTFDQDSSNRPPEDGEDEVDQEDDMPEALPTIPDELSLEDIISNLCVPWGYVPSFEWDTTFEQAYLCGKALAAQRIRDANDVRDPELDPDADDYRTYVVHGAVAAQLITPDVREHWDREGVLEDDLRIWDFLDGYWEVLYRARADDIAREHADAGENPDVSEWLPAEDDELGREDER